MTETIGWAEAALLGILQGMTEFLPVSSSGHLVLGQAALGLAEPQILFDILVHVGTLAAVLYYYGKDALRIVRAWFLSLAGNSGDRASARTGWLILLGTVPAGIFGVLFEDFIEGLFGNPRMTSLGLLATGALLFFGKSPSEGGRGEAELTWRDALFIGSFQALAIIPGISRSGSTITSALFLGIDRETAARFSFLLSIPAIGGALLLKARHFAAVSPADFATFVIGAAAAAGAGVLSLGWLIRVVRRGNLKGFAYYCWALGIVGIWYFWNWGS
jgi:undecaprenyl-diphosphatase